MQSERFIDPTKSLQKRTIPTDQRCKRRTFPSPDTQKGDAIRVLGCARRCPRTSKQPNNPNRREYPHKPEAMQSKYWRCPPTTAQLQSDISHALFGAGLKLFERTSEILQERWAQRSKMYSTRNLGQNPNNCKHQKHPTYSGAVTTQHAQRNLTIASAALIATIPMARGAAPIIPQIPRPRCYPPSITTTHTHTHIPEANIKCNPSWWADIQSARVPIVPQCFRLF